MIKNYFRTAVRNLLRHRFFSFINIFGLSVSMTICMGIIMLVADQMTYDLYNSKRDRIYRVTSQPVNGNGKFIDMEFATSPLPIGSELKNNYAGIEKVARLKRGFGNSWVDFDRDINIPLAGFYADPEVIDVFEYEFEHGDPKTALIEPFTVVLTKRAAEKLFEMENPVGETVKVGELGLFTITGVLKETNRKSHIVFEALASMATVSSLEAAGASRKDLDNWHNHYNAWTYLLLEEGKDVEDLQPYLSKIYENHIAPDPNPDVRKAKFDVQRLNDITPGRMLSNPIGPFLPWMFIYFLGGLAAVVMLTSCFNFTNLSIARSLTRAKEIGIRKVLGANSFNILRLLSSEFVGLVLIANLVAFPIVWYLANKWLEGFAYRTTLSLLLFLLPLLGALVITLITVGVQTLKAAMTEPVTALRHE